MHGCFYFVSIEAGRVLLPQSECSDRQLNHFFWISNRPPPIKPAKNVNIELMSFHRYLKVKMETPRLNIVRTTCEIRVHVGVDDPMDVLVGAGPHGSTSPDPCWHPCGYPWEYPYGLAGGCVRDLPKHSPNSFPAIWALAGLIEGLAVVGHSCAAK